MVKKRSEQKKGNKPPVEDPSKAAEELANELSDKPYGQPKVVAPETEEIERLTISLPVSLYDDVEALAKKRKRAKSDIRSMSAIARVALQQYLENNTK